MSSDCACLTDMGTCSMPVQRPQENARFPRVEHRVDGSLSVNCKDWMPNAVVYTPALRKLWIWTLQIKSVRFHEDTDTGARTGENLVHWLMMQQTYGCVCNNCVCDAHPTTQPRRYWTRCILWSIMNVIQCHLRAFYKLRTIYIYLKSLDSRGIIDWHRTID